MRPGHQAPVVGTNLIGQITARGRLTYGGRRRRLTGTVVGRD
jgi:hypothetical protein